MHKFEKGCTQSKEGKSSSHNMQGKSSPSQVLVHAKLEMSEPGDADELEADSIASEVMSGGVIHRKISDSSSSGIALPSKMSGYLNPLLGGGNGLPSPIKSKMETSFGRDFSSVRVHSDSNAAEASRSIGAQAFTYGNDIFFNQGKFNPGSEDGQRLIAHELVHVVQANNTVRRKEDPDLDQNQTPSEDVNIDEDAITTAFPFKVKDFHKNSKAALKQLAKLIKRELKPFRAFVDGTTLEKNTYKYQTPIPSIKRLMSESSKILNVTILKNDGADWMRNTTHSALLSENGEHRIAASHPEVRKYLLKYKLITEEDADLVYLWARYSPEYGNGVLLSALGFKYLSENDYVTHHYRIRFLRQGSYSGSAGVDFGVATEDYSISYWNDYGLRWKMNVNTSGVKMGAGVRISFSNYKECIDTSCTSDATPTKKWYSPFDMVNSTVNMGLEGVVGPQFSVGSKEFSDYSYSGSFMNMNWADKNKGKGETLSFSPTGEWHIRNYGFDANLLSLDMSAKSSFEADDIMGFHSLEASPKFVSPRLTYDPSSPDLVLIGDTTLYFETGSFDIDSAEFGKDNRKALDVLVAKVEKSYELSRKTGNFIGIDSRIVGSASPQWKHGERKNMELSQKRADAAQQVLAGMLSSHCSVGALNMSFKTDVVKFHDTSIPIEGDAVGDTVALEETGDNKNNDKKYRSVQIYVTMVLGRVENLITDVVPTDTVLPYTPPK